LENALETRKREVTITNVPPYDDFGDWATPKKPTAELFFSYEILNKKSNWTKIKTGR
jgi:hypothetical protein